ncbi:unnamed protein product, partial [Rotaria sp. Silwood2]
GSTGGPHRAQWVKFSGIDSRNFKVEVGDMHIMFEPNEAFLSDVDTESPLQIGFVETTPYFGYYYIKYNPKTKFHSILRELDIFKMRNNKQYISSKKLTDLLHSEFVKYNERGPLPMLKIPSDIHEQWINRPKQ